MLSLDGGTEIKMNILVCVKQVPGSNNVEVDPVTGYAKKAYLKAQYGATPIALMQGIKRVFDEKNILNPGKICF